jgi:DNA helicase-2/ATP-dependent DNA helicase PcrA
MPYKNLNKEQLEAVNAPFGNTLVIASAGTGKTSTIVARIYYLLENGIKPENILLLTFTNKAAAEMTNRLKKFFDKNEVDKIQAGTFHAVSYKWLKILSPNMVLKQPGELKTLFNAIHERYINTVKFYDNKPYSAGYLYDFYESFNASCTPLLKDWLQVSAPAQLEHENIYLKIFAEFELQKEECGFLGFSDLLIKASKACKEGKIGGFFEVLVDEYQDTNNLQHHLVESVNPKSMFCVGDYDQSIYGFNGANISIIAGFGESKENAKVYTLTKNYRSTAKILQIADTVIRHNDRIYPKQLEVVRSEDPHTPRLLIFDEVFDQYKKIADLIRESNSKFDDITVLFRNNSSADGIEASLREHGIKCRRKGGVGFFEAKEVKAILDILTLAVNPKDILAFINLFEYASGVGGATAKELCDALLLLGDGSISQGLFHPNPEVKNPFVMRKHEVGLFDDFFELGSVSRFRELGLEEGVLSNPALKHPKLNSEAAVFFGEFYSVMHRLMKIKNPKNAVDIIKASSLYDEIKSSLARRRAMGKDKTVNTVEFEKKIEQIDRKNYLLSNLASHYDDKAGFLNAMILGAGEMSEGEGVNLLSVHASKGLEFREVFVIDLMDGRFPNRKLIAKGSSIEEERRLFYVAVTRAKDRLVLSYAKYDKIKKTSYEPSQFLKESGMLG